MSDKPHISETVSAGQLRAFIERIERVEEEIKALNGDKSDIYKELRGCGFDVKAVRQCVAARKLDSAEREERTAIFELYWDALTGASRVHVREAGSYAEAMGRQPASETTEPENQSEQPCTATGPSASLENASDTISSINSDASSHDATAAETGDCVSAADQFSRAPVETDPLREQADVTASGPYPREAASGDPEKVQLPNHKPDAINSSSVTPPPPGETEAGADAPPPVSAPTNSEKPHCLKLRDGECRLRFETTALCSECNAERMKARAQA